MRLLAIAFLIGLQQPMTFKAPQGADPKDVVQCAKAITARIAEYGYKEITAAPSEDRKSIVVNSASPFNNPVRSKVYRMATTPMQTVELRFAYPLTPAEAEQYPPGGAAPKGTTWLKWSGGIALMRNEPVYSVREAILWYPQKKDGVYDQQIGNSMHLEFGEGIASKLFKIPKNEIVKVRLFIDGQLVDLGGNLYPQEKLFKWTIDKQDGWDVLGVCVNHPMTLALSH